MTEVPWKIPPLDEWSIVGMNHYFEGQNKSSNGRSLYVALRRGDLCIRAEGPDGQGIWDDLCVKTILVVFPKEFKLEFDPAKSKDQDIRTIFSDRYGGLIWCALRYSRLTDQHFNASLAAMLTNLRALPGKPNRWLNQANDLRLALPPSIFGNHERRDYWAEALHRMVSKQQGEWTYKVSKAAHGI